jgi:Spy/CpxP family protein refolding chaperone
MKFTSRFALGAMALGGMIGMAGMALGQEAPAAGTSGPPAWHRHVHPGMLPGGGLLIALRQLDLSPAQRQQVRTILQSARGQFTPDRDAARSDFLALSNPGDPNYQAAVQAAEQRATARIEQASKIEQQIYGVLTTAQQQALPGVLASLQANRGSAQHGGPPAPPPAPAG